jgi:uncharacterized protein YegP (UPF0339 family)
MAAKFERHESANGEFRGRLKSANGQNIATGGEGYTRKGGAINGIEDVERDTPDAVIEDQTAS